MERKELTCIRCPKGCALDVDISGREILSVSGNGCPQGENYARKEITNPTRTVTTTVKVRGGRDKMVSVRTRGDIPRQKIFQCMRELKDEEMAAPVHIGDIVAENIAGTGVDVVATREVLRT